jgi:hypothetical protein
MRIVIIESPYAGDVEENVDYARACLADCLRRGEAPYASHLLYTQPGVLRDEVPDERTLGMTAGFEFYRAADLCAVYIDRGISRGMKRGIAIAEEREIPVEYRELGE